jgi:hypothetical protein
MGDLFLKTMDHLEPALRADELEDCEKAVVDKISAVAPPQKALRTLAGAKFVSIGGQF